MTSFWSAAPSSTAIQLAQLAGHDQRAGAHVGLQAHLLGLGQGEPLVGVEQPVERTGHDAQMIRASRTSTRVKPRRWLMVLSTR